MSEKARLQVMTSYMMMPKAKTSEALVAVTEPRSCSGDMYLRVPPRRRRSSSSFETRTERPKSATLTTDALWSRRMFPGLRSLWMISLRRWRYSHPCAIWWRMESFLASPRRVSDAKRRVARSPSLRYSVTMHRLLGSVQHPRSWRQLGWFTVDSEWASARNDACCSGAIASLMENVCVCVTVAVAVPSPPPPSPSRDTELSLGCVLELAVGARGFLLARSLLIATGVPPYIPANTSPNPPVPTFLSICGVG